MYKIIAAVNSMIENAELISNVTRSETRELFFLYNGLFTWSISKNGSDDYALHYYPDNQPPEELANLPDDAWETFDNCVTYRTSEIKTKEAFESFSELYTILQNKLYNIDSVLDDIINTAA